MNLLGAILLGVLSSGGLWTLFQFLLNRRGRIAESARLEAAEERDRREGLKAEADRLALIQEIERTAYDRAVSIAEGRVEEVKEKCNECLEKLVQLEEKHSRDSRVCETRIFSLEQSNYALVDAALEVVPLLDPREGYTKRLKSAIRTSSLPRSYRSSTLETESQD